MDPLTMAAAAAGGKIMGIADELIMGKKRRKDQLEQQQKLTDQQTAANKELADYGMGISKEMWDYTNYQNQRKHMEQAGLNPALMYGSAGSGGTTSSASAGQATGGHASDEASRQQAQAQMEGMALQRQMAQSQIELNKSQAQKNVAEAEKTKGVDTELAKKSIEDITATVENKKVQKEGMLLDNDLRILNNIVADNTTQERVNEIIYRSESAKQSLIELTRNNEIGQEVKDQIIESYRLNTENIATEMILKNSQAQVNRETAKKIVQDIKNSIDELKLKGKEVNLKEIETEINRKYQPIQNVLGKNLDITVEYLNKIGW